MADLAAVSSGLADEEEVRGRYFALAGATQRGLLWGRCFHPSCRGFADWHNREDGRYYCERCATDINAIRAIQGRPEACRPQF